VKITVMAEVLVYLFVFSSLLADGVSATTYTNDWAVEIEGTQEEANMIALRYGFVNLGTVSRTTCRGNCI
jgi:hypothetical protein